MFLPFQKNTMTALDGGDKASDDRFNFCDNRLVTFFHAAFRRRNAVLKKKIETLSH
jgi:hypothetical protein